MPGWLLVPALAGAASALFGVHWDDAWHTERGRDSFLIAPHLAIYLGIASVGGALLAWAALALRRAGARAALAHPPLLLGLVGVAVTLGSGPIDDAWHRAFGRDAVIWSPPHMLGVAGTAALAAAVLAELAQRPGRRPAALVAAALLLAALCVPVLEYETDVPQFDEALYLPVLAAGAALALGLARAALGGRSTASRVAALQLALVACAGAGLEALGFGAPLLPLLVVPAAALDLAAARRLRPPAAAAAFAAALHAAYVPHLALREGVRLDAADLAVSLPLSLVASWAALAAVASGAARGRARGPASAAAALAGAVLALLAAAPAALAHDPGQGDDAGRADLRAEVRGQRVSLFAAFARPCAGLRPDAVVARRAGELVRGPLAPAGTCRFRGAVRVPTRGRWFVYAQLRRPGGPVEAWLPVKVGSERRAQALGRHVYKPPQSGTTLLQVLAGVLLYALVAALLWATVRLAAPARYRSRRWPNA